jgi:SulP family sulfate permease
VQYGLFAVPLALLGYAVFGTCRELFVEPSATIASLSAATVVPLVAATSDASGYVPLTAVLALTVGMLCIVGGLARLGFIAHFFARPVLDGLGLGIGIGIYIAVGQLPKLVGIPKPSGNTPSRSSSGPLRTSAAGRVRPWRSGRPQLASCAG